MKRQGLSIRGRACVHTRALTHTHTQNTLDNIKLNNKKNNPIEYMGKRFKQALDKRRYMNSQ